MEKKPQTYANHARFDPPFHFFVLPVVLITTIAIVVRAVREPSLWSVWLVVVAFAPWPLGYFDAVYGVTSLVLGSGMLALALNVYRRREGAEALRATRKLFAFSILYLFALFATLLIEVVVHAIAPSIW